MVIETIASSALRTPLTRISNWVFDGAKDSSIKRNIDKSLKTLSEKIENVVKVKTFYQINESIDLHEFYVPTRINDVSCLIDKVEKINTQSIVLEGTVGQGKSILMRYLTYKEATEGKRVPIFYELRRIEEDQSLEDAISNTISNWITVFKTEHFPKIAASGELVLFLDGFDELPHERMKSLINEIEGWQERYPSMQIVISARPESEIQKSTHFKVYKLSTYTFPEQKKLVEKLISDKDFQETIINAIRDSSIKIKELLKTPLMVTLFIKQYQSTLKIPTNQIEFYENLFYSLTSFHDNTKAGFVRKLNSGLDVAQLQGVFEEFCFISAINEKLVFSDIEARKTVKKILENQNFKIKSSDVLKDFSTVACLLLKEGNEYSFIHRSVQEYYSSSFILGKAPNAKESFYTKCFANERLSIKFENVLKFLEKSDTYYFYKFFEIPILNECIRGYQISYGENIISDSIYLYKEMEDTSIVILLNNLTMLPTLFMPRSLYSLNDSLYSLVENKNISHIYWYYNEGINQKNLVKFENYFPELFEQLKNKSIEAGNNLLTYKKELEEYINKKDSLDFDFEDF